MITDTPSLAALCQRLASADYVTVDTEFMREKTFWPILCLVQIAGPDEAWAIDPMAPGIDLSPLAELMANPKVLKVFHAARQDIEIFLHIFDRIPAPLFDTQVAAMVCGFGDSVGYDTLAAKLAKARIDKSLRFTDWARRPLSDRQVQYALADVTHLRVAYEKLAARLEKTGRTGWLDDEMAILNDPATYRIPPEEYWLRLKPRSASPRFLAVLREVVAWREREARERDMPRQRILKDEQLLEIAAHAPSSVEELAQSRGFSKSQAEGKWGHALLEAVKRAKAIPDAECPRLPKREEPPRGQGPLVELLKLLLKVTCEANDVAQKLIASQADIEAIAVDDSAQVPALEGWRRQVFGEDALRLKQGRLALACAPDGKSVRFLPIEPGQERITT